MVTGQIKLGAIKELSGKPLSCDLPEGFFYWRHKQDKLCDVLHRKANPESAETRRIVGYEVLAAITARQAPNFILEIL